MKRGIQKIRSHLIEAVTELVRGPGLYPWVEPGAQGRSPMQVATDLLKEEAFIRKDHDDVSYPLTDEIEPQDLISYITITGPLGPLLEPCHISLSRPVFLRCRKSWPCSEQRDQSVLPY
jgi:hypothetical protein